MTPDSREYAGLAQDAYHDQPSNPADNRKLVTIGGHQYRAIEYAANNLNGFHATAYQRAGSNEIVIAIRGTDTDFKHDALTTLQDIGVDAAMVAGKVNPQEADARTFVAQMIEYAKQHGIPLDQISITGHSLGGTLAEIEAARYGLHGETFNAYGAAGLGYHFPPDPRGLINHVLVGDAVSAASRHLGQVRRYATPEDIQGLRDGGYLSGNLLQSPIVAARWSDHGIGNFAPAHGPGVMTAANEARAREYAAPIASYRGGVRATHDHLRDALQPNLLHGVPGRIQTGADVAAAAKVCGEHALANGAQRAAQLATEAGNAVEQAAARAANTAQREARAIGSSIESGVHAARDAVVEQATDVQRAARQAGVAAGEAVGRLRNNISEGASQVTRSVGVAASVGAAALPSFSNPDNPQHAVYAALKARMPPGTSEDRLAQCVAACHASRLDKPEDLGQVYVTRTKALFLNHSLFGQMAEVDLTHPAPAAAQSLRQSEQVDQQQVQAYTQPVLQQGQGYSPHR